MWPLFERIRDGTAHWCRRGAAAALQARPVPQHIAFIMDGNRRFADRQRLEKVEGHNFGYKRLIDALEWCLDLGVRCVSVYAFSIDNYQRSGQEVATLMRLAEEKLAHMLEEHAVLERHGVRVCIIGDLSLAPPGVQRAAAAIMAATAHHASATLNICFSYTSSQEMLHALDACASSSGRDGGGAEAGREKTSSWSQYLYTEGCPPVDLLVRTSGETRLSDFLLWQCRYALLVFTPVLWPDFGFPDLLAAVLAFQRGHPALAALAAAGEAEEAAARARDAAAAAAALAGGAPGHQRPLLEELRGLDGGAVPPLLAGVKSVRVAGEASPRSVATPPSPSSPSAGSDGSDQPGHAALLEVEERQLQPPAAGGRRARRRKAPAPRGPGPGLGDAALPLAA